MSHDPQNLNDVTSKMTECPEMSRHVPQSGGESVPPRPVVSCHVPQRPDLSHTTENCKTKPFPEHRPRDLTPRQLAAARLLAHGYSSPMVAATIGTTSRTINRWKLLPAVRAEVRRLHDLIAVKPPAVIPSRKPRGLQSRRNDEMSDDEVREAEALIDELLGNARK